MSVPTTLTLAVARRCHLTDLSSDRVCTSSRQRTHRCRAAAERWARRVLVAAPSEQANLCRYSLAMPSEGPLRVNRSRSGWRLVRPVLLIPLLFAGGVLWADWSVWSLVVATALSGSMSVLIVHSNADKPRCG